MQTSEGAVFEYAYDALRRPVLEVHPRTGSTSTSYDSAGRVSAVTNAA